METCLLGNMQVKSHHPLILCVCVSEPSLLLYRATLQGQWDLSRSVSPAVAWLLDSHLSSSLLPLSPRLDWCRVEMYVRTTRTCMLILYVISIYMWQRAAAVRKTEGQQARLHQPPPSGAAKLVEVSAAQQCPHSTDGGAAEISQSVTCSLAQQQLLPPLPTTFQKKHLPGFLLPLGTHKNTPTLPPYSVVLEATPLSHIGLLCCYLTAQWWVFVCVSACLCVCERMFVFPSRLLVL